MRPYLVLVCFAAAVGGFLFGFDTSVISGAIEFIETPQVFGLSEIQKGWAVSCIIIGCMMGCILAGKPSQLFGRKKMLLTTAFLFLFSTLGCSMSQNFSAFIFYRILAGVAVGSASMLAPMYASQRGQVGGEGQHHVIPPHSCTGMPRGAVPRAEVGPFWLAEHKDA